MTCLHRTGLVIVFALCSSGVAVGQSSSDSVATDTVALGWARKLLNARHAQEALLAGFDSSFAVERKAAVKPGAQTYFDSVAARVHREAPQLLDSVAVVWAGRLSLTDLQDLVRFYESPLGTRYASAEVSVDLQTRALAQRWGMRVAFDVMKDLIDKGLVSPSDLSH